MFNCIFYVSLCFTFAQMFGDTTAAATPDPSA